MLAFWDARVGSRPVATVRDLHDDDINCVHWNPIDTAYIVTGGSDCATNVIDWRRLATTTAGARQRSATAASSRSSSHDAALQTYRAHDSPVMTVQWSPYDSRFFASSADDSSLYIWNTSLNGASQTRAEAAHGPPELVFRHCGHRGNIVDYEWKPHVGPRGSIEDEWTFVSVSDDSAR
jgi:histone-binding protein RBBP4